jgi:hypothetical protein
MVIQSGVPTEIPLNSLSEEQVHVLLEGLPPHCWAAYVMLGKRLVFQEQDMPRFVDGRVWLPPIAGLEQERWLDFPPILHDVIGIDLGKAWIKLGGIDDTQHFVSTTIVDAYCKAKAVQHESGGSRGKSLQPEGMTTYTLLREKGVPCENPKGFWISKDALPWAEKLPIEEAVHMRLKQSRVKELVFASVVEQLAAMGRKPSIEGETEDDVNAHIHYIVLSLGLPYSDVSPLTETTKEAIRSLYGAFELSRQNTHTGKVEIWRVHITSAFAYPQTRGTDDAWGMKLNGDPSQSDVVARTIIDPGGGDSHVFHVTEAGTISFIGEWVGRGTIELAEALIEAVKKEYGITLSEPAAQLALFTREIRGPGGKIVNIDPLLASLQSKKENMLTRLSVTEEMKSTLVIFTGGGSALLHDDLKQRLKDAGLQEGLNFIVVPKIISQIMSVIGLTARGLYRAQAMEQKLYGYHVQQLANAYQTAFGECPVENYRRREELSQHLTTVLHWLEQLDTISLSWPRIKPHYDYLQKG